MTYERIEEPPFVNLTSIIDLNLSLNNLTYLHMQPLCSV